MSTRVLLIGLLVVAGSARATSLRRAALRDLVRRAERVLCAECTWVRVRPDPRTGLLFTHVTLNLLEDLKGRSGAAPVELRLVGGRLGDRATVVPGMPRFAAGTEYVLFLGPRNGEGYPTIVQLRRGVLRLRRDARGRRFVEGARRGAATSLDALRAFVAAEVRRQREEERRRRPPPGPAKPGEGGR
ncbi:MAG: hypothetical protein ACE5JG_04065 [Planctomycetota bacterium]